MDEREEKTRRIKSDADDRDQLADARDTRAARRDMDSNLESWVKQDDPSGAHHDTREAAARDRKASKADRTSAAEDRTELAEHDAIGSDADHASG